MTCDHNWKHENCDQGHFGSSQCSKCGVFQSPEKPMTPTKSRGEEIVAEWFEYAELGIDADCPVAERLASTISSALTAAEDAALERAAVAITEGIQRASWRDQDAIEWVVETVRALKSEAKDG